MAEERLHSGGWQSTDVRCPFWIGDSSRAICCEGLTNGETIRRLLPNKEAKAKVMAKLCCRNYETCKIFQLVYGGFQ